MQATHSMSSDWTGTPRRQSIFARLVDHFGLAERMEARRLRQRLMREMDSLTDSELADLGIDRRDIPRIARGEMVAA